MTAPATGTFTVVSFESRMADETARMLEKAGARALSAPSMQEVPLDEHGDVFRFGEALEAGEVDVLVCLTGVGTRMLVDTLGTRRPAAEVVEALSRLVVVTRGPKPVRALKEMGVPVTLKVPEPNTWRELLQVLDESPQTSPLKGKNVAIQEYGESNDELIGGLAERGARVLRVPIYRWALPDDLEPLRRGIRALIDGEARVAMFTSRTQVDHVLEVASAEGWGEALMDALDRAVVASIGPVCSRRLREHGIQVDVEPEHPKLGFLIRDIVAHH